MNITDFENIHKGETCVILGNGPSLNSVDLHNLPYKTFGSNRVYLSGYHPDYYACVNPLVLQQYGEEIKAVQSTKFLNAEWAEKLGGVVIDTSLGAPMFAAPDGPIWEGHTVTYVLLQLAYFMGFKRAILLGVDHDFGRDNRRPNLEMVAAGPDKNHFHPDYFSGGARWNAPDLARSELAYTLAKRAWEADGRVIVNASSRTKLTVFPLYPLRAELDCYTPRVSAIVSAYKCPAQWVVDTIDDLLGQTEPVEIVVVCEEGSGQAEAALSYDDTQCVIVHCTHGIPSVYAAWNIGIQEAHGRYITNANTDDRRHPLSLQTLADVLDARPEIDVAYHDQYVTWDEPQTYAEFMQELSEPLVNGRQEGKPGVLAWADHSLAMLGSGCYLGPQPMWRASLHQRYGYFNESYKSAGDYEFWLRCAKEDNYFHVPAVLGVYCARADGVELGDPTGSAQESLDALMLHQEPDGIGYHPMGKYIRAELGGKRVFADAGQFFAVMEKLRGQYR
jgi:hypothetical protein